MKMSIAIILLFTFKLIISCGHEGGPFVFDRAPSIDSSKYECGEDLSISCEKKSNCPLGEHLEEEKCVSNLGPCELPYGKGERIWSMGKWGPCMAKSCDFGHELNLGKCEACSCNYPDLRSCKALSFYEDSQKTLMMRDENWCGEYSMRFQLINKGEDLFGLR